MIEETAMMFTVASDSELNDLAAGVNAGYASRWSGKRLDTKISAGTTGVFWQERKGSSGVIKPVALVVREADGRRLFGRFSQLHGDLSPITTWCHVLSPRHLEVLDSPTRMASLSGFEAAWAGLIVAEAIVLAGAPPAGLKTFSCFATQSWAIARSRSLWPNTSVEEACERLYEARRLTRGDESRLARLRQPFQPVWSVLAAVSDGGSFDRSLQPLVTAIRVLADARAYKDKDELAQFANSVGEVLPDESRILSELPSMGPEDRLGFFDLLVSRIATEDDSLTDIRRTALAFMAGYVATKAAGGSASLGLATDLARDYPQIAAWAYAIGGVGEHVTWTASFDGLGRLIVRELLRPFRLDDQPDCDFSLDEGLVLADAALSDPLVHLRIKQGRNLAITIYPGVNVTVPLPEQVAEQRPVRRASSSESASSRSASIPGGEDVLALLTEIIWERIAPRLREGQGAGRDTQHQRSQRTSGFKRKSSREPSLPLSKAPR